MLPIQPIAQAGESAGSIFLRAASANGWKPSGLVRAHIGASGVKSEIASVIMTTRKAYHLADRLGIDRSVISSVLYHEEGTTSGELYKWNGLTVKTAHLRWQHPAVCPSCLAADQFPYARSLWDHHLVSSCQVHHCQLIDTCPSCKLALSWDRPDILFCRCGFDLRKADPVPTSPAEHKVIQIAVSTGDSVYLDRAMQLLLTLRELLDAGGLSIASADLPEVLGHVLRQPRDLPTILAPGSAVGGLAPRIAIRRLLTQAHLPFAEEMLSALDDTAYANIPGNWEKVLAAEVSYSMASAISGFDEKIAGKCYRKLQDHISRGGRPTLEQVNALLLRFYPVNPTVTGVSAPPRVLRGQSLVKAFNEIEGGSAQCVGYKHLEGLLTARISFSPKPNPVPPDRMTLNELANGASVHYESIRFLYHSGFLPPAPPFRGRRQMTVYRTDGEEFLKSYRFAGALAKQLGTGPTVFAAKLMSAGLTAVSGPSIDGALTYLFKAEEVEEADLKRIAGLTYYTTRAGRRKNADDIDALPGVTFRRAAEVLGCSVQKVMWLPAAGLLILEPSKRRERRITRRSFDEFAAMVESSDYLPTSEAAKTVGETEWMFRKRWITTGIIPERNLMIIKQVARTDLQKIVGLKSEYMTRQEYGATFGKGKNHISNQMRIGRMVNDGMLVGATSKLWLHPRAATSDTTAAG